LLLLPLPPLGTATELELGATDTELGAADWEPMGGALELLLWRISGVEQLHLHILLGGQYSKKSALTF